MISQPVQVHAQIFHFRALPVLFSLILLILIDRKFTVADVCLQFEFQPTSNRSSRFKEIISISRQVVFHCVKVEVKIVLFGLTSTKLDKSEVLVRLDE